MLRDNVFIRLRDAIVDGTLQPGEQLRDIDLAERLGVSRTPVREALLRLAEAGLVRAQPGKSTVVSPVEPAAVASARDVVAAIHQLVVGNAVPLLTPADFGAMRAANERFAAAIEAEDTAAALRADDEFHDIPVQAADNFAASAVLEQFTPVLRRAEALRFGTSGGHQSVARHANLIRLCERGNASAAAQLAFDTWHSLNPTPNHEESP